jgi:hypothetical protein
MSGTNGISVDGVAQTVENTFYTVVGLGVLGVQHLRVQRRQMAKQVSSVMRQVADQIERTAGG